MAPDSSYTSPFFFCQEELNLVCMLRQNPYHWTNKLEVASLVIRPVTVADIILSFYIQASVRLKPRIISLGQFTRSLSLPKGPIWYLLKHTTGLDVIILLCYFGQQLRQTSYYLSDIGSYAVQSCL